MGTGANPFGALTDVPDVHVGHAGRRGDGWLTGCTVVVPPPGTCGGTDLRGGGPATAETPALAPGTVTRRVDAVMLTGGSAFGLAAAAGVLRWCEQQGRGFDVGVGVVPIVPALALFDLGRGGDPAARPDAAMAHAAAAAATGGPVATGGVGAGTGALCARGTLAAGVGTASRRAGEAVVGALVVLNAAGSPLAAGGDLLGRDALPADLPAPGRPPGPRVTDGPAGAAGRPGAAGDPGAAGRGEALNTTLVVVATDAALDPAGCATLAAAGSAGLARAVHPVATLVDGDSVVALSTGVVDPARCAPAGGWPGARTAAGVVALQAAAAQAVTLAALDAVLSAEPRSTVAGPVPSCRAAYPWLGPWPPG